MIPADTESPYWLMLNGRWLRVDWVAPNVPTQAARPSSEMITLDGRRLVQQAERGPRTWQLDFTAVDATALAALAVATDAPDDVWLLDETMTRQNMLSPRVCYGASADSDAVDCAGLPLPALDLGTDLVISVPVRAGVTHNAQLWSGFADEDDRISVDFPGGSATFQAAITDPGFSATAGSFVPDADGQATLTVHATGGPCSGLMLTEHLAPSRFAPGTGSPCRVAVDDPARTIYLVKPDELAIGDYSVQLREVG